MKIKAGVNFHNRFDIVKNGEWVGCAENIILDQMYNRICNFSTYFNNIHFGTGSGTPTPDRTSLFNHLGTKTAVVEETVKALPTSKVTKKIVLMPEEYVGQNITEVGVAYGDATNYLVTHAMIKDAEGNPLSINKTDLDVIEIYATVFITFDEKYMLKYLLYNDFVQYFLDGTAPSSTLRVGELAIESDYYLGSHWIYSGEMTRVADVTNKKIVYTHRVPTTTLGEIREFAIYNSFRFVLPDLDIFTNHRIEGEILGTGDGSQVVYNTKFSGFTNPTVYIDGVQTNDYSIVNGVKLTRVLVHPDNHSYSLSDMSIEPVHGKYIYIQRTDAFGPSWMDVFRIDDGNFTKIGSFYNGTYHLGGCAWGYDEVNDIYYTRAGRSGFGYYYAKIENDIVTDMGTEIPPVPLVSGTTETTLWKLEDGYLYRKSNRTVGIELTNPAAVDSVVTIDYDVPYMPKDENYVVDFTIEVQFGEGV